MSTAAKNLDAYVEAVKRCLIDKRTVKATAAACGVPRSSLQRHVKKVDEQLGDISHVADGVLLAFIRKCTQRVPSNQIFSPAQEAELVDSWLTCVRNNNGSSISDFKRFAYQFAKQLGVDYRKTWDVDERAGDHWYYKFMARNPHVVSPAPEPTTHPAEDVYKANVKAFFKSLRERLDERHIPADRTFNMDELGFSTTGMMQRVGQLEAAERGTSVSMALTVGADGTSLPPFFLFPRKQMQASFLDNVSSGAAGFANESGWMAAPDFVRFMRHFIAFAKPSLQAAVLLLLDSRTAAHLTGEAFDLAAANGVHVLTFPAQCSRRLQPLDVSVFGAVEEVYKAQCSAWQKDNANRVLKIRQLAGLVCKALDLALNSRTIKAGFTAIGICPFNQDSCDEPDVMQKAEEAAANDVTRVLLDPATGHTEHVTIKPEPSSMSSTHSSVLDAIDPLLGASPQQAPPNLRGRIPKRRTVIVAPPERDDSSTESTATKAKKPSAKRATATKAREDCDICMICKKLLPIRVSARNAIECTACQRPVHRRCADIHAGQYTCKRCDSADADDD